MLYRVAILNFQLFSATHPIPSVEFEQLLVIVVFWIDIHALFRCVGWIFIELVSAPPPHFPKTCICF